MFAIPVAPDYWVMPPKCDLSLELNFKKYDCTNDRGATIQNFYL